MEIYVKKKQKVKTRTIILIILFVTAIILGFISNVVHTDRELTIFEKSIKDGVIFVQRIVQYPINFVIEKFEETKIKNNMYDEYINMKEEVNNSELIENENTELKKQIEDLKKALDLNETLTEYDKINATVIGRDLGYWNDTITIDKGEENGIEIGMPAVVSEGLIGKVIKTTAFTSTVRLLTANNSNDKISVKIAINDSYAYGILSQYNEDTDTYTIEGIADNFDFKEGLIVTTTGMGDIFPSGIVIGNVVDVTTDQFDLAKILEIKSSVDFDNLNYVTILKRSAS